MPASVSAPAPRGVLRASPAALWRRVAAWVIDGALLAAVVALYLKVALALTHHATPATSTTGIDWIANRVASLGGLLVHGLVLGAAVGLVYSALCHALGGQTLGKRLLGIRLVDGRGRSPSLPVCVLRGVLQVISAGALMLGFLLALFTRRRQALHDALTATYVVRPLPR